MESRLGLLNAPFIPIDGMNEKGVAIGMMAVPSVQLPFDPAKRTTTDLGMIRVVLAHDDSLRQACCEQFLRERTDPRWSSMICFLLLESFVD